MIFKITYEQKMKDAQTNIVHTVVAIDHINAKDWNDAVDITMLTMIEQVGTLHSIAKVDICSTAS